MSESRGVSLLRVVLTVSMINTYRNSKHIRSRTVGEGSKDMRGGREGGVPV